MRRLAYASLLALPFAAAACGGSKNNSNISVTLVADPASAVKGAAAKTAQAGSEHLVIAGRIVASGQAVTFKGSGDFDTKKHRGSLSADFSAGGLNGSLDELSSGTDAYIKSELLSALVPGGKTWVKIDLAKTAKAQGVSIASFLSLDPTAALTQLQGLRDVQKVGTAGGTTHYRAKIDLSKLQSAATTGTGRYDVWIGEDGYVHRVKAIVTASGSTSTVTTDLSAFGEPVSITLPKPADTFDGTNTPIPGLGG
jgi:hypothetical protein